MELWGDLVRTALLGTERGGKTWSSDGRLGEALTALQGQDAEPGAQLLRCAAVVGTYAQAGRAAMRRTTPPPQPAAPDSRPVPASAGHLRLILGDERLRHLLGEWLGLLAQRGLRVPETSIPTLLGMAVRDQGLRRAIMAVIGAKGHWLAAQNPEWAPLLDASDGQGRDDALWETGSLEQRLAWLIQLRLEDPESARARLAEVWKQEGARERRRLIEALSQGLESQDAEFLTAALADRSKEVRSYAAELLAKLPDSTLQARLRELLGGWLTLAPKAGLIAKLKGRRGQLDVRLPEAWDKAWERLGISEKAPKGLGQKAWWLEQMLGLVDPRHWAESWQSSPEEIIALVEGHDWQKPLLAGWQRATLRFSDTDWARALLRGIPASSPQLWALLGPPEQEDLVATMITMPCASELFQRGFDRLDSLEHAWSAAFSEALLQACLQRFRHQSPDRDGYGCYRALRHAAARLDPALLQRAEQAFEPYIQDASPWQKIATEMLDVLRFRSDMPRALDRVQVASE
ncbi:DUF5691 domain-containing protein [Thiorhodococcus minor]|uniref:Uncharacterized protein n=1 Tax=Thiorhodococcus minor TaxID=57489 RepID=A0A6M0K493_9GAMM|nr:DUF5691 domain-containing protein [Thiorhodococcus minor]NEV64540.1 hypothetical protein [Thiorhodococcus minor]